ncbi:sulfide/dihydroorotate dehydrogenase-like FAD/NAD-binding protein [Desulfofundulus thermocisternus]|uniref:sulfide/dihydroorotate dehydrogenase-like FAD/NAD-binding protein n=1 Tax=Desulfofundulus thermocisternus TaxID=42471 RepID=UPI0019FD8C73|nr:sulfide/dihydroorotate dehydrogenase-like FAD/NAD-binding protein [Desulfofundulus thermocisternus]MBE3584690.1 sulfide/dihydroorotate dehydrogenase-like FAD/NAD-binding protein [Thermoanaerobacter sp.]MCS5694786.1 sulfide/dihydroorotate dehydrogenase-like FAD/NAD-binding protein [Desulfofundulus thermocisternus]
MFKILDKQVFSPVVKQMVIEAPRVARRCQPGQFVILRIHEEGERIPLTIADFDREKGTITIVFQEVGKTTRQLGTLEAGDYIRDFVGPLGAPSHIENFGTVICVGGGVGIAPVFPIARALKEAGNHVISIIGARSKDLLFWEDRMREVSSELFVTTDDGSYVRKGFVTDVLKEVIEDRGRDNISLVLAIGPQPMMRACCDVTRDYGIKTIVSLNALMVDGTGMCGCCRVTVGGQTRFVCVDGPEFDGHQVDFVELARRSATFRAEEQRALERHTCQCGCGGGK